MSGSADRSGTWRAMLAALLLPACATIFGPPDDPPPEALTARLVRSLSPNQREQKWPPQFDGREYIARLICPSDDWLTAKPLQKKGLVETYELSCPGEATSNFSFDIGLDPPPPPQGFRLLEPLSLAKYREAFAAAEKKDYVGALRAMDEAHAIAPEETIYQRDRVYLLYQMGKLSDAFLEADAIAASHGSAVLYKYRALAARDLGLRSEVLNSLDAMARLTHEGHPLYAEAICAKGLLLMGSDAAAAEPFLQKGCSLNYASCCDVIKARGPTPAEPQPEAPKPLIQASSATHG